MKRVARRRTQERTAAQTMKERLAIVDEERDDSLALLPFDDSKEKRRLRNELKARAHEFSGTHSFRNQATFVTGGGLPRNRKDLLMPDKNSDDDEAILSDEDPEDALLREVEQYENEFKEMFKYLQEVEEMVSGSEVAELKKMKEIQNSRL